MVGFFFSIYVFFNVKFYPMEKVNKEDRLPTFEELLQKGR
jgi:hypothetical protein